MMDAEAPDFQADMGTWSKEMTGARAAASRTSLFSTGRRLEGLRRGSHWSSRGCHRLRDLIDLQMYLDNLEMREKLRKDWDKKFSDLLPKKKEVSAPIS